VFAIVTVYLFNKHVMRIPHSILCCWLNSC